MANDPKVPRSEVASPRRPEETILVQGRALAVPVWEAEVTLRAAGWIGILRGAGMSLAVTMSTFAAGLSDRTAIGQLVVAASVLPLVLPGLALVRGRTGAVATYSILSFLWMALVVVFAPPVLELGSPLAAWTLKEHPWALTLLPFFLLPELYANCALWRRAVSRVRLEAGDRPASLLGAWRVRATGGVIVAVSMVVLCFLGVALALLMGPALFVAKAL